MKVVLGTKEVVSLRNESIRSIKQFRKIRTEMYPVFLIIWKSLETTVIIVEL